MEEKNEKSANITNNLLTEKQEYPAQNKSVTQTQKDDVPAKEKKGKKKSPVQVIAGGIVLAALVVLIGLLVSRRLGSPELQPEATPTALPVATIVLPEPVATEEPEDNSPDAQLIDLIESFVLDILSHKDLSVREATELLAEEQITALGDFDLTEVEDTVLVGIADYYLQALELELQSFEEHYQTADLLWLEGYLQQMQVLTRLYNSYGLCKGNVKFIGAFISPLAETSEYYSVYKVVSTDLQRQVDATTYLDYVNDHRYSITLRNGTNYTYDMTFTFLNYDKEDEETRTLLCTAEDSLQDMEPLKNYVVTDRSEVKVSRIKHWELCWHLDAVKQG